MALSCSYIPRNKKGEELKEFQNYKKELGYKVAAKVFTQVISPSFKEDYKSKLVLDKQGVPTYVSAITVPYVKNLIGNTLLINADQKGFPYVDNTRENYLKLVRSAQAYNTSSPNRDRLIAVVTAKDNQIRVEIKERNETSVQEFQNQYGTALLNERLMQILGDLGINITMLEGEEMVNGYVDFSKASSIADGFAGLINLANGMEGELALPEEVAHLLIGMFRDTPLVQRSLNQLMRNPSLAEEVLGDEYQEYVRVYGENPNYDTMGNEIPLEEAVAEEALGKILQEKLKSNVSESTTTNSFTLNNLIHRLVNWIKKTFRGFSSEDIIKAKNEVDTSMGELAKNVLQGSQKLSNEELIKSRRNARFNSLKSSTDKILELLRNATEIERKRSQIVTKDKVADVKAKIVKLESLLTDKGKLEGVHTYAKWALKDLQEAMDSLTISGSLETYDFKQMRHTKSTLDSYSGFIKEFHEALDDLGDEATTILIAGEEVNLRELWRDINDLYESCNAAFMKQALAAFSDFLAPIYDKSPLRNPDGSIKPIKEVLTEEDFDISEFDRWLTSMGNSSSLILQLFDKAVKNAKDRVRFRSVGSVREIWAIRDRAEQRGIATFEWMFEKDKDGHKTGNYISKYNEGQYEKDKKEMLAEIEKKYGRHPVGEDFTKARAERNAWYASHSKTDMLGFHYPGDQYLNPAYSRLSVAQKETLEEILAYKAKIERLIPKDRRNTLRAIQRRRTSSQRLFDSATNPSQAVQALKDDLISTFSSSVDDDILYGSSGLTDFTGQEYMTLPILYTGRLENPDTLSTDIFGDLMAYSYMATTYDEMSQIYDPLEIGVSVVAQKDFIKSADSKVKEEIINVAGRISRKSIKVGSNTSFAKKLRDYLECQVYGRYMKEDDIVGKNTQKTLGFFQRLTSTAYLGCNYLAGVANIATAVGMQNIEAAAGEFFGAKELALADIEYGKMMPLFLAELASRKKQSELALFDELFDVRQNVKDRMHNVQMKSIFRRFFGENWLFIQQGMGDHWIYNRTALAMAKRQKVKVDGKVMSVWDAREIVTDKNGYKTMRIKPGAIELNDKGEEVGLFNAGEFSRRIAHINHTLVGIYNDDDQNAANRVIIGRMAQQMRKWIIPQMMRRFQSKRTNLDIGREEEGYYITLARLAKDISSSGFKIMAEWKKLNASEKANIRRAFTEMGQTLALWIIVTALGSGVKDPDRSWAAKFAEYMLNREMHELGFLTPSPLMLTEGYKTITSPMVVLSAGNSFAQALLATANPSNWFEEDDELIQSGPYKGHSHLYKRWAQVPLPPMTQIRQIDKFVEDLDTGTKYYSRDYK